MTKEGAFVVEDPYVEIGHQDEDPGALVGPTYAQVVEPGAVTKGHAPRTVHHVVTDLGGRGKGLAVTDRHRLVHRPPSGHRGTAPGLVGPLFVVDVDEPVDLGL